MNTSNFIRKPGQMSAAIKAQLLEMGRTVATEPCRAIYEPLQPRDMLAGVRLTRDVQYGPAARNRLDVFTAASSESSHARPVLLFVHGGGYVGGDKHTEGSPFYSNVGAWAARNGLVGVNMTHRLAKEAPWPAAQEDIAAAIGWVKKNIAEYGGDPERIFLMGHSAGATHVASYVAHPQFHGNEGAGIAGAILVSGVYDFESVTPSANFLAYHGDAYAKRSSLPGLLQSRVPLLCAFAEIDLADTVKQSEITAAAFTQAGRDARFLLLEDHSHMSELYAVNTEDSSLTGEILSFITRAGSSRP